MKISFHSATGTSHKRVNTGCQDNSRITVCPASGHVVAVVSDGAGSARYGADGSAALVEELSAALLQLTARNAVSRQSFSDCVKATLLSIRQNVVLQGLKLQDFHATLVCLLRTEENSFLAHIGDGVGILFFLTGEELARFNVVFSLPENGESSNETFFFTDPNLDSVLRIRYIPKRVDAFILSTDGMQDFLFEAKQGIKQKFCNDVLNELIVSDGSAVKDLARLVTEDPRTDQYTNDDKSLAMGISRSLSKMPALNDQFIIDASNAAILWGAGSNSVPSINSSEISSLPDSSDGKEKKGSISKKKLSDSTDLTDADSRIEIFHLRFYQALSLTLFLLLAGALGYISYLILIKPPERALVPLSTESKENDVTLSGNDTTKDSSKSSDTGHRSEGLTTGEQDKDADHFGSKLGGATPKITSNQEEVRLPSKAPSDHQSVKGGGPNPADTPKQQKNLDSKPEIKAQTKIEASKQSVPLKTGPEKGDSK